MPRSIVACDEHAKEQEQDRSRSGSRSLEEEEERAMGHTTVAIGGGVEQEHGNMVVAIAGSERAQEHRRRAAGCMQSGRTGQKRPRIANGIVVVQAEGLRHTVDEHTALSV